MHGRRVLTPRNRRGKTTTPTAALILALLSVSLLVPPAAARETAHEAAPEDPPPLLLRAAYGLAGAADLFVRDAWHICTFPRRLDRRGWLTLGGVTAAAGLAYAWDEELRAMAHRNEDADLLKPLWELGDFFEPTGHMGNTNIWYIGGLATSYLAGWDRPLTIFAQILESHYIAGLGKNAAQSVIGRPRPFEGFGPREFGRDDATSFPSGHASNIFQVAVVLSHHGRSPWISALVYTVAGSVAVQRVRSDMHWPSDVLLSSVYGFSVARAVVARHEQRAAARLQPHVSRLGYGAALAWNF